MADDTKALLGIVTILVLALVLVTGIAIGNIVASSYEDDARLDAQQHRMDTILGTQGQMAEDLAFIRDAVAPALPGPREEER